MKFHADPRTSNQIEAVGTDWVRIAGHEHRTSLLLRPDAPPSAWSVREFDALLAPDLAALDTQDIELVILGTGARHRQLDVRSACALTERGVGIECMNNAAACRSYNVLLGEGRRVLLALLMAGEPARA